VTETFEVERMEVLEGVRRIVAAGLVSGSSGNVSRRIRRDGGDLMAVTASGVAYRRLSIEHVVVVDLAEIEPVYGDGVPSSESLSHAAIYTARADVGAVVHTHSVHASAYAVAGRPIPAVMDEQSVYLGGAIEVAEYGPSSSEKLAQNAVHALADRAAVLLRNHGVISVGAAVDEACNVAELVERVAHVHLLATALGGAIALPDDVLRAEQQVYRMMKGIRA